MNYQHSYHAGNLADVVKHIVILELLDYLKQKASGFCFIDTHAGAGMYDLESKEALKTLEADAGINLLQHDDSHPEWLTKYLTLIDSFQDEDTSYYPGSPLVARAQLREQDEMIVNEKHLATYETLSYGFRRDHQVHVHQRDAYEFLPAVLPPKDKKRALILIDPPFEKTTELEDLTDALEKTLKRFAHGVYAIWFPLTSKAPHLYLPRKLKSLLPKEKHLYFEFAVEDPSMEDKGLIGCAMLIINPPWKFDKKLKEILTTLWPLLSPEEHGFCQITLG